MFIAKPLSQILRSSGARCVQRIHPAPLEPQSILWGHGYKHSVPPGPKKCFTKTPFPLVINKRNKRRNAKGDHPITLHRCFNPKPHAGTRAQPSSLCSQSKSAQVSRQPVGKNKTRRYNFRHAASFFAAFHTTDYSHAFAEEPP